MNSINSAAVNGEARSQFLPRRDAKKGREGDLAVAVISENSRYFADNSQPRIGGAGALALGVITLGGSLLVCVEIEAGADDRLLFRVGKWEADGVAELGRARLLVSFDGRVVVVIA